MRQRTHSRPLLGLAFAAMGLGVCFELLRAATDVGGPALDSLTENWVYMAVEFIAIAVCGARVVARHEHRRSWGLITLALACWSVGDLLWAVWLDHVASPPFPSPADAAYLLMYPAMYGALMLFIRSGLRSAAVSQWLDGGVVALSVCAVAAAVVFSTALATTHGRFVAEAITVAYPVGDFILLMFVVVACTLADWRPGRDLLVLGAGVALMAACDILDVEQVAGGIYVAGTLLNALYLTSFSLLALAAWAPSAQLTRSTEAPHTILLTLAAAGAALCLLLLATRTEMPTLAVGLAAGSLVLASVRSGLSYLENVRILRARSREAVTDSLTMLGNRRQLLSDLEHVCEGLAGGREATLAFFDLNGFKRYNDSYGHGAGDALLVRLAASLRHVVADHGCAYRLGGDEFCVLLDGRYACHHPVIETATASLAERGRGFAISAARGVAIMPDDATTASATLRIADERMYADKGRAERSETRDVLIQLLSERTPGLAEHVSGVTSLTMAVAAEMGLSTIQVEEAIRAAELHDIGKLAIPDEILNKPGPLDDTEWEFMRQHPIIGERILCAAPALATVAKLVRASHERWDGGGYPDGLAGTAIPAGARIVAVCDAYDAMVSDRCYQRARSSSAAIAELRHRSGTQFDPAVVEAICRHLLAPASTRARAMATPFSTAA